MFTVFVLFVVSTNFQGGVGFTYEFKDKHQCESVLQKINKLSDVLAFCQEVYK